MNKTYTGVAVAGITVLALAKAEAMSIVDDVPGEITTPAPAEGAAD